MLLWNLKKKPLSLIDLPTSELSIYKMIFMAVLYESDPFIQNANTTLVASVVGLWVSCELAQLRFMPQNATH